MIHKRVSIRPGVHHPGERGAPRTPGRSGSVFQSAPGFITPGNRAGERQQGGSGRFNPPRGSSPRGTGQFGRVVEPEAVSIRPGVHHPGEPDRDQHRRGGVPVSIRPGVHHPGEPSRRPFPGVMNPGFQSAPGFITPGNARGTGHGRRTRPVSIRPGVHHPGERAGRVEGVPGSGVSIRPGVHHPGEHDPGGRQSA